ncbi:MAG: tyrosine--tRNA ligase [Gammaproteobacteria bacterium]
MTSSLIGDLRHRGLVAQATDESALAAHLDAAPRTLYCGFDASADSLHHAHLLQIVSLRRFQLAGHRPIALVGGATGLIGDPSFKSDERVLLERDEVASNAAAIARQIESYIDFEQSPSAAQGALLVNNLDWTERLDVITFLRDVGKYFSVNEMMRKESVRARLEREGAGISFTEFSYQILQANDYLELARRHDCTLQIGGNDQWGNITAGMDLVRRALGREAYALTSPLITKADGTKFGKTETGTIWLAPERTSPFAFYQFWINTADADVGAFLRYFTFLPMEEIETLGETTREHPEKREAQRRLAREMTSFVHGRVGLEAAERITGALFSGAVGDLTESDLAQLAQDGMEHTTISGEGEPLVNLLACTPVAAARGAARRLVSSGGVSVNAEPVKDVELSLSKENALFGRYHLLRRGKKSWHLIAWE